MPDGARSWSWRALHGEDDPRWGVSPASFDPIRVEDAVAWLGRLFGSEGPYPVDARGLARVPSGPNMFVSNHSGGSTVLDCLGLGYAWYRHFDPRNRPLHFLAHEILLATRLTGPFFNKVGVLRTSRKVARKALGEWKRDVIVMPGGDRDTWRPWRDRYRVRFAGHLGYARLALQTRAPVVPVAHAGPHNTLLVITDGKRLAQRLSLHELFRIDVCPIHLSLPWGLGIGPLPHLPLPRTFHYRFGAPVELPDDLEPDRPITEAQLADYDQRVRSALQELLDELSEYDQSPLRSLAGW